MQPVTMPSFEITVDSTKYFHQWDHIVIDRTRYVVVQIVDEARMRVAQVNDTPFSLN